MDDAAKWSQLPEEYEKYSCYRRVQDDRHPEKRHPLNLDSSTKLSQKDPIYVPAPWSQKHRLQKVRALRPATRGGRNSYRPGSQPAQWVQNVDLVPRTQSAPGGH